MFLNTTLYFSCKDLFPPLKGLVTSSDQPEIWHKAATFDYMKGADLKMERGEPGG